MLYLKWTVSELATLDLGELYTEVDEDGWVQRELGVDYDGSVTHVLVPTTARPGWFGATRVAQATFGNRISKAEFDTLWKAGSKL